MKKLNFIFVIQGEGKGHLTQAISLYQLLEKNGHKIRIVIVGKSLRRIIPSFFTKKIHCPIIELWSPNFTTDKKNKSISLIRTVVNTVWRLPLYFKSASTLKDIIDRAIPDIIINFYDPLVGLYKFRYKNTVKTISIAHQYAYLHSQYKFPEGKILSRICFLIYTKFTAYKSDKILGLSIIEQPNNRKDRLTIIPPLLRKELFTLVSKRENFTLIYLVNSGYYNEIINWHLNNPKDILHCFMDSVQTDNTKVCGPNLTFHTMDDKKFLDMLSRCNALVTSAGFETISEAIYLKKPIMTIPVLGHYEQFCNSRHYFSLNKYIYNHEFNLSHLNNYLPSYNNNFAETFKFWIDGSGSNILYLITA